MDKSMQTRRIRTAPVSLRNKGDSGRILEEVKTYERRLQRRSSRLHNEVSDAWVEGKTAKNTAGKVVAGVRQAFKEIQLDSVSGELKLGQYLAKKLKLAGEAGILDPGMDVELAMLRAIMRKLG